MQTFAPYAKSAFFLPFYCFNGVLEIRLTAYGGVLPKGEPNVERRII